MKLGRRVGTGEGNNRHALELLVLADNEFLSPFSFASLARAYRSAGETGSALAAYEKLLTTGRSLGLEPQQDWIEAHYWLAKLYASHGEKQKARKLVDAFLGIWKEADLDLPLLRKTLQLSAELRR